MFLNKPWWQNLILQQHKAQTNQIRWNMRLKQEVVIDGKNCQNLCPEKQNNRDNKQNQQNAANYKTEQFCNEGGSVKQTDEANKKSKQSNP